ncbi:uncharacterized protein LOC114397021 [Glycine soja]|uniref:uncharacterized protein LOC114397021 n=1 Tax=Glycine soja TaxID=3848 RepID=UPI00103B9072|nr:uncharacterized protein LOC114397021 [Glycine soja]
MDWKLEWEPITDGFHMKLRSWCGKYLRGNSGMASWRNSVTHNWILCDLEPVHEFPVKIVSFTESKFSSLDSEDELPSSEGESLRSQNSQRDADRCNFFSWIDEDIDVGST